MAKKENKNLTVWFGDTEEDMILRKRIAERCKYMPESAFMKEAAEEKLNKEDLVNGVINQSIVLAFDKNTQETYQGYQQQCTNTGNDNNDPVQEFDVDGFLDSID